MEQLASRTPPRPVADTTIVAFIGVDGAGKSSLIDFCRKRDVLFDASYVHNQVRRSSKLISTYHRRETHGPADYLNTTFARDRPFATGFDFLEHYHEVIIPLLGEAPYVVCDRYASSAMAYFVAMGHSLDVADDFFANVRPADLTFYVHVDMDTLEDRHRQRGGSGEDEAIALMRAYADGFEAVLPALSGRVVRIDNSGDLDDAAAEVAGVIASFVSPLG